MMDQLFMVSDGEYGTLTYEYDTPNLLQLVLCVEASNKNAYVGDYAHVVCLYFMDSDRQMANCHTSQKLRTRQSTCHQVQDFMYIKQKKPENGASELERPKLRVHI